MSDLKSKVRQRYLNTIDDGLWDEEDPRLDFGPAALPFFVAAFAAETDPARRCRLIRVIWQFRDAAALPTLAVALRDASEAVWKESLDGFVALGGPLAKQLLADARAELRAGGDDSEKASWIDEAAEQIAEGLGGH